VCINNFAIYSFDTLGVHLPRHGVVRLSPVPNTWRPFRPENFVAVPVFLVLPLAAASSSKAHHASSLPMRGSVDVHGCDKISVRLANGDATTNTETVTIVDADIPEESGTSTEARKKDADVFSLLNRAMINVIKDYTHELLTIMAAQRVEWRKMLMDARNRGENLIQMSSLMPSPIPVTAAPSNKNKPSPQAQAAQTTDASPIPREVLPEHLRFEEDFDEDDDTTIVNDNLLFDELINLMINSDGDDDVDNIFQQALAAAQQSIAANNNEENEDEDED
jgi:hypothetical protein